MSNQFINPWTGKEIEFLRNNIGKLTYVEMGGVINRTYSSIQSKIRHLPFKKKIKKHPINFNFFKKWSSDMSYVLGFIAADGNVCRSGRVFALHIASDDLDIIEKIRMVMRYEGPIREKRRPNGKISYSLRICDHTLFNDLVALGITEQKSLTLVPPKVPSPFIADFLRGFFDGDGTIYLRNIEYPSRLAVAFYTASRAMAQYIHLNVKGLLGNLDISKIRVQETKQKTSYYTISLGHKASVKLCSFFYTNAGLYVERKFQKFLQGANHSGY